MKDKYFETEVMFNNYLETRNDKYSKYNLQEYPNFINLLGDVKDKKILDLGCGIGILSFYCAKNGAKEIISIDSSEKALKYANDNYSSQYIDYMLMDIGDIKKLNKKFDIIMSSFTLNYIQDLEKLLHDVYDMLNDNGILVFSQPHPLSTAPKNGMEWHMEEEKFMHYKLTDYGKTGKRKSDWFGEKSYVQYHRTFSDIVNMLVNANFKISKLLEPLPSKIEMIKFPRRTRDLDKPAYILIKATK